MSTDVKPEGWLPPLQQHAICQMCGHDDVCMHFCGPGVDSSGTYPACILRECRRCAYTWREACGDFTQPSDKFAIFEEKMLLGSVENEVWLSVSGYPGVYATVRWPVGHEPRIGIGQHDISLYEAERELAVLQRAVCIARKKK